MKGQTAFSDMENASRKRAAKRDAFLREADAAVPRDALVEPVGPCRLEGRRGRRPTGTGRMLRMRFPQLRPRPSAGRRGCGPRFAGVLRPHGRVLRRRRPRSRRDRPPRVPQARRIAWAGPGDARMRERRPRAEGRHDAGRPHLRRNVRRGSELDHRRRGRTRPRDAPRQEGQEPALRPQGPRRRRRGRRTGPFRRGRARKRFRRRHGACARARRRHLPLRRLGARGRRRAPRGRRRRGPLGHRADNRPQAPGRQRARRRLLRRARHRAPKGIRAREGRASLPHREAAVRVGGDPLPGHGWKRDPTCALFALANAAMRGRAGRPELPPASPA